MGNHQGATVELRHNTRPDRIDHRHQNELRREDRRDNRQESPRFQQGNDGNRGMGTMGMGRMGMGGME
jgi:hypothetical protein